MEILFDIFFGRLAESKISLEFALSLMTIEPVREFSENQYQTWNLLQSLEHNSRGQGSNIGDHNKLEVFLHEVI